MMNNILETFFEKTYEDKINFKNLSYSYVLPEDEIKKYICDVCSINVKILLNYIKSNNVGELSPADIFQFSSFNYVISKTVTKLIETNDPGLNTLEIGKLLLDDGKERKNGAYTKYGENHVKGACLLGLCFCLEGTYFVSSIGYVFNKLDILTKEKLLTRLILRTKLIQKILQKTSSNKQINAREFFHMLSDSTFGRRKSNIKRVIAETYKSNEYDFEDLFKNFII